MKKVQKSNDLSGVYRDEWRKGGRETLRCKMSRESFQGEDQEMSQSWWRGCVEHYKYNGVSLSYSRVLKVSQSVSQSFPKYTPERDISSWGIYLVKVSSLFALLAWTFWLSGYAFRPPYCDSSLSYPFLDCLLPCCKATDLGDFYSLKRIMIRANLELCWLGRPVTHSSILPTKMRYIEIRLLSDSR